LSVEHIKRVEPPNKEQGEKPLKLKDLRISIGDGNKVNNNSKAHSTRGRAMKCSTMVWSITLSNSFLILFSWR
jgi:hypothetical protein